MTATVLYEDRTVVAQDAREEAGHLWLSPAELEAATGWTLKPEGLCRGEACVPLPRHGSWTDADGRVDLTAFAERFKRPVVRDEERSIWGFGDSVGSRVEQVESGLAPGFELPDIHGGMHRLEDFLGRKVFLLSWGSY
jgi:hypothetical protein